MQDADNAVVIVGAGHAGGMAAAQLRQCGYSGPLVMVGAEAVLPYQRPPLSKAWLKGELDDARLYLKPDAYYTEQSLDCRLSASALALDAAARSLELSNGERLSYRTLILATGAEPLTLKMEGHALEGVLTLRTLADAQALRTGAVAGARAVIVGGGYIGLEAAASLRQMGLDVVLLEAAPRVLGRVAGPEVSAFYEQEHRARGVDLRVNACVSALHGDGTRVSGVRLASGELLPADIVLVGIGVRPAMGLAQQAGLVCEDGIVVDEDMRTSDANVFAIGDCVYRPLAQYGRSARLESVHNAVEGARIAAAVIAGRPRPSCDVPWFWSDQYDLKLQTAGLLTGYDETVLRGDPAARSFAVYYLREGRLLAVDAVNAMADFLCGKKLAGSGVALDVQALREATDIKQFAEAARG